MRKIDAEKAFDWYMALPTPGTRRTLETDARLRVDCLIKNFAMAAGTSKLEALVWTKAVLGDQP